MRSFHPTVEDGDDSKCDSLGLTDAELEVFILSLSLSPHSLGIHVVFTLAWVSSDGF